MISTLLIFATFLALPETSVAASEAPAARAWQILQQGLASHRAGRRESAVHALRLLSQNPQAQNMAERALADGNPKVRAAAARALGPMGAVSSAPKLKALLNDKEPGVVLAAARSLFLLGDRNET
jgi:HEAT repeat protein